MGLDPGGEGGDEAFPKSDTQDTPPSVEDEESTTTPHPNQGAADDTTDHIMYVKQRIRDAKQKGELHEKTPLDKFVGATNAGPATKPTSDNDQATAQQATNLPGAVQQNKKVETIVEAKRRIRASVEQEASEFAEQGDGGGDETTRINERRRNQLAVPNTTEQQATPLTKNDTIQSPGAVTRNEPVNIVDAKRKIRNAAEEALSSSAQDKNDDDKDDLTRIHQRRRNRIHNQAAQKEAVQRTDGVITLQEEKQDDAPSTITEDAQTATRHPNSISYASATVGTNDDDLNTPEQLVAAEIVEDPVQAEVVDEEAQKQAASKKYRRTISIVVLSFLAVLLMVVGGLCGNGFCSAGSAASVVEESCDLFVSARVNVKTNSIERPDALSKSPFVFCSNLTSGEPIFDEEVAQGLCALAPAGCQELPYQINMLFNGGSCADNEEQDSDWNSFSCQDGVEGSPPIEFAASVYLRVTDILLQDVTYFDDYTAVGNTVFLTNRGAPIGPDILIRIYDSEESAEEGTSGGLLQTVFYYDICSDLREELFRFGAVQPSEYFYGSQTLRLSSDARTMEFEVLADGPTKLLQEDSREEDQDAPAITINDVVLTPSFSAVFSTLADNGGDSIITFENTLFEPGILVATGSLNVPWIQNTTDRFTLQAEVAGTGPNGEDCSGIGVINFLANYV